MHDLRQLAESIIGAADFNDPDDALCDEQKAARDIAKECRPLAAFDRDMLDETPVNADWLDSIYPPADEGWERFQVYKNGSCYFSSRDVGSTFIGLYVTRGQVRAFALGMSLQLTEGEE